MLPMANSAKLGSSWWSSSIARKARMALSAGMSTRTTSAFARLDPAHQRVGCRHRKTGMSVHRPSHAGTVHQNLQHGALLVIRCNDYNRKFGHDTATSPTDSLLPDTTSRQSPASPPGDFPVSTCCRPMASFHQTCPCRGTAADSRDQPVPGCSAEMRCTVHNTINSVLLFCTFLLLNRLPRIGMSPSPESCYRSLVSRLSIKPAITKLCPSCSSNSVSARRVLRAGMLKPEIVSPLAKSN